MALKMTNGTSTVAFDQTDTPDISITIPAGKLDADQYSVDDIDGVTESIFGSGNMSYAMLQAAQTDESIGHINASPYAHDSVLADLLSGGTGAGFTRFEAEMNGDGGAALSTNTDRSIGQSPEIYGNTSSGNESGFTASTAGAIGASQLSADVGRYNATSAASGPAVNGLSRDGENGRNPDDATNGQSGQNGADGQSGVDGQNGTDGDGVTIINIDGDIDLGDVTELVENVLIELGDTVTHVTNTVTEVTDSLTEIINNLLGNTSLTHILDLTEIANLTQTLIETVTETLATTLTEITSITGDVTDLVQNLLGGNGDGLGLNLGVDLNPVTDLVQTVGDLTGLESLADTLSNLGGATELLQDTITQVTDVVNNLDLGNPVGAVEELVDVFGNLDDVAAAIPDVIDGAVGEILDGLGMGDDIDAIGDGVGEVVDTAADLVGDVVDNLADGDIGGIVPDILDGVSDGLDGVIDGLAGGILGGGDSGNDGDVGADVSVGALDLDIVDDAVDVALDPVEDLVGDIDLGLGAGLDLLGQNGDETDNDAGDTDIVIGGDLDIGGVDLLDGGIEIPLDPVEEIIGDVDIDLGLATGLLEDIADPLLNDGLGGTGDETILSDVGDVAGDIAQDIVGGLAGGLTGGDEAILDVGLDLTGEEETANAEGDTDISVDLGLGDAVLPDIEIPLDPVEDIIGDIDLDLDVSGVLGMLGGGDTTPDNSDTETWTETAGDGVGGLFDDIIGGIGGNSDPLPDPVGSIAEGLGVLDIEPALNLGGLGGLFG